MPHAFPDPAAPDPAVTETVTDHGAATAAERAGLLWHGLTPGQLDFWEEHRAHAGCAVSTVAHVTEIVGSLDEGAMLRALARLAAEAEVLSLRFRPRAGGGAEQAVDPAQRPRPERIDLSADPAPEARARARMAADIARPLDLTRDRLSRLWLFRLGGGRWFWYCRGHHIFLDGYAMAMMERRVAALYAEETTGTPAGAPFRPLADHLAEAEAWAQGAHHAAAAAFWREEMAKGPAPETLRKGSEDYPATPLSAEVTLAEHAAALRRRAEDLGLGWPDLLIMLCGLWHWQRRPVGQDAVRLWLPLMGRMGSVCAAIPCMALNILPWRVAPVPEASLTAALTAMKADLVRLRRHGRYRVEELAAAQGLAPAERYFFSPLVNVMPFETPVFPGLRTRREVLAAGPGDGHNMTISATPRCEGLTLWLEADPARTDPARFAAEVGAFPGFLGHVLRLLADEAPIAVGEALAGAGPVARG